MQFLIQSLIDGAEGRGAIVMTAELFGDGLDFTGTDPDEHRPGKINAKISLLTAFPSYPDFIPVKTRDSFESRRRFRPALRVAINRGTSG